LKKLLLFSSICIVSLSACKQDIEIPHTVYVDELKINQLQTIGSHNSYRIKTRQSIFDMVLSLYNNGFIPAEYNPNEWDYTHIPLQRQFDEYKIRSIELDIYHDPQGGRFYLQKGNNLSDTSLSDTSFVPALNSPGFKIMHIPDFDYNTHHYTFKDALINIENWSDAHPNHFPLYIMVELKTETVKDAMPTSNFTSALPFTKNALDSLDNEIKEVFGSDLKKVITPDLVRGKYTTLKQAVLAGNWPKVKEARGKVLFILMTSSQQRTDYLLGHNNLTQRVAFVFSSPENGEAAFLKYDNPLSATEEIKKRVEEGYIIRTRADAGTTEARTGDYSRMNIAFESGAQLISTDYYQPDSRCDTSSTWSCYSVNFPLKKQVGVVNPVNGPDDFKNKAVWE
jgi:hypothetical protein